MGGAAGFLTDDVAGVAQQTLDAAGAGLDRAMQDPGLRYTFFVLTQVALAGREENWRERLEAIGVRLPPTATVLALTAAVQAAIDGYVEASGRPTDISEMAQQAAGESLTTLLAPRAETLFGGGRDELLQAMRGLSTRNGFADLGQRFFGGFMFRFLNFYLSRVTASAVGGPRLQQVGDLSSFNDALRLHCEQTATIVREFAGGWYSKTEWEKGISPENTGGFMAVALKKLQAELAQQGVGP
jgi:hypothetical protein